MVSSLQKPKYQNSLYGTTMEEKPTPKNVALRSFFLIILIIFIVEILIMIFFRLILVYDQAWLEVIMDATILTFVQFPTLYYLMLRPMEREIAERSRSENELRRAKELLEFANREVNNSLEREQVLASTDGLTGLNNYRRFVELASREFEASMRYQRPLAVIIFDLDYFQNINDSLGHVAGDKMLITVCQAVANQMRSVDVLARYGGDEFVILLPETGAREAFNIAERIRISVAAGLLMTEFNTFAITLSMGVSELLNDPADGNIEQVVQRADRASHIAKETGRNRTAILPAR